MRRIKITFAALLPLLWLAAAACHAADVRDGGASDSHGTSVSAAAGHSRHYPAGDVCSSRPAARSLIRRAGTLFDPNPTPAVAALSAAGFSRASRNLILFPRSEAPAELTGGWQFHWRTASEPRAPSTVS